MRTCGLVFELYMEAGIIAFFGVCSTVYVSARTSQGKCSAVGPARCNDWIIVHALREYI